MQHCIPMSKCRHEKDAEHEDGPSSDLFSVGRKRLYGLGLLNFRERSQNWIILVVSNQTVWYGEGEYGMILLHLL